jgi:hypothetical protein
MMPSFKEALPRFPTRVPKATRLTDPPENSELLSKNSRARWQIEGRSIKNIPVMHHLGMQRFPRGIYDVLWPSR